MTETSHAAPDSTAVRVALRRALQVDAPPQFVEDETGLKLPAPDWLCTNESQARTCTRPAARTRIDAISCERDSCAGMPENLRVCELDR